MIQTTDKTIDNSDPVKSPRLRPFAAIMGILILFLFVGAAFYLTSPGFNAVVRDKVVATLQQTTGGRVDLKSLKWNISKLDIEIDDLTIHGLEGAQDIPYAHVDHMSIRLKIVSFFKKDIGLRYLGMTHPVVHLIVYPDGRTNQPTPKAKSAGNDPVQTVFDLAVERAELSNGLLLYNDRKIPFDVAADKLAFGLTFLPNAVLAQREYDASIKVGALSTGLKGSAPLLSNAETQIALHPDNAEIKVLRWSSPHSRLEASGKINDLHDPHIALSYNASMNAIEAAHLLKMPALRDGMLDLSGSALYHGSEYTANGKLSLRDFSYRTGNFELTSVNATTRYAIDPKNVELKDVRGALFGGSASGSLTVADWSDSKRQQGKLRLEVASISVEKLLKLSGASPAMQKVRIDSNTSGTITAGWIGSPANANAVLALDFAPQEPPDVHTIALTGLLDAQYSGAKQALSIAHLDLHSRATQVTAQGSFGLADRPDAGLQLTVATQDLDEFTPVLAALNVQKPPVALHGNARFDGSVTGSVSLPHLLGHLAVNNFDVHIPATVSRASGVQVINASSAPAPAAPTNSIHWDALAADIDYTPDAASVSKGVLRRGSATVSFDGGALLRHKVGRHNVSYSPKELPFHARINIRNASLQDLQALAGYNYPLTGTLQTNLNISGTLVQLNGGGNLQIINGSAYGEPFKSLQADVRFTGDDAQITRLHFSQDGGVVDGTATYDLPGKSFTVDLRGSGFNLAHFKQLQKGDTHLSGAAQFQARASGTAASPSLDAHLQVSNVIMNGEAMGNIVLDAKSQGETLHFNGGAANKVARLNLDGDIRLRGDYSGDAHLKFSDFDVAPLLKIYMPGKVDTHSRINGEIDLSGPFKNPKLLTVIGNIPLFHVAVENFALDNKGPLRFAVKDEVAHIEQLHLTGDGTDLTASANVALTGSKTLDADVNGTINLKILRSFNRDVFASGVTALSVKARGTLTQPSLLGEVDLNNASLAFVDVPNGLSNIKGKLVFTDNRLVVQQLTAQTGGGQLNLGGFVSYKSGVLFDLTATGQAVRVRYQGMSTVADADLRLTGTPKGATLGGDVLITKFAMNQQFDLGTYIARSKEPPATPDPTSIANRVRLDVHVASSQQLAVQTSLATLSGDVDVTVRGTALNPLLLGRVNIAEGDILFQGTKYHLDRGDVTFTSPLRIDPVLNVEASATIRDYDITLGFHGPLDHLNTTYRSEPPLPTSDIISLLAFQRTTEEAANAQTQTSFTETAQNAVLGEALNAAVSSRIQKLFGISKVKIDPQGGGLENNKPSITVEQQVKSNLTVTFVTYPTQSNQQLIQVEYNVNKNVSIVGIRDQYGVLGIDVRLRQRKR